MKLFWNLTVAMVVLALLCLDDWRAVEGLRYPVSRMPGMNLASKRRATSASLRPVGSTSLRAVGTDLTLKDAIEDTVALHATKIAAPIIKKMENFETSIRADMDDFREQMNDFQALKIGIGFTIATLIGLGQFLGDNDKQKLATSIINKEAALVSVILISLVGSFAYVAGRVSKKIDATSKNKVV
jgi:hypothetical protein